MSMNIVIENHFRDSYDKMIKRVLRPSGSLQNAEDIVMEAYTRALKYSDRFDPNLSTFEGWFQGILRNSFKDFVSDVYRKGMGLDVVDKETFCGVNFNEEAFMNSVNKEISNIKDEKRQEVVRMYVIGQYKPKEISEAIGVKNSYVRNTVRNFFKFIVEKYEEK